MAKKLLGPWNVAFPVRFHSGGDTTSQAFGKHIQEIERIYGLLNALDVAKIGNEELTELLINIQNLLANLKHNDLKEIQGGSATERYHLTSAQVSKLDNAPAGKDHNTNLTGHQGGSSTERYHLTAAQVSKLDNAPAGKDHNTNLTGLQGGSATERYHLTAAQVSKLNGAADSGDIIKNHNSLQNIQGGNSSERYHLTSAQVSKLDNAPAGKDHNTNLTGLQGGSSTERYHLTAAQVAKLNGAAGSGDIITQHNSLQGIQGGDSSNRYHLTKAQLDGLSNLITNPPKVFNQVSLNDNGYIKFENGFIFQWGLRYFSRSEQNGSITCNFTTAFTQKCFGVIGSYGFNHHGAERSFLGMWPRGDGRSQFGVSIGEFYNFTNISGDQVLDPCFRWLAWGK